MNLRLSRHKARVKHHELVRIYDVLVKARKFYDDELEMAGGCDHSVGICLCDIYRERDELQKVIDELYSKLR